MIRQQAFIGKNQMLKGGLHCHTTRSDGALSPKQIMNVYKNLGYDFLAITDCNYDYIRISIADKNGKLAWTNPIFLK